MIKPFVWMFSSKKLIAQGIGLCVCLYAGLYLCFSLVLFLKEVFDLHPWAIFGIKILPFIVIQGYFFELTESVIQRKKEILAPTIYNGKVKEGAAITPPKLSFKRFLWRGIASITATILLYLPYALLVSASLNPDAFHYFIDYIEVYKKVFYICFKFLSIAYFIYIPALLWNYTNSDSVFGVWDIRRTSIIVQHHWKRYIFNILIFGIFYYINYHITAYIIQAFPGTFFIYNPLFLLQYVYFIFVTAYLVGTLAPAEDAIVL